MSRWLKHHEGPMYRVVLVNHMSDQKTYYGPYSQLKTARGVLSLEMNSWYNKRRTVPNTGYVEETQTQWYQVDE